MNQLIITPHQPRSEAHHQRSLGRRLRYAQLLPSTQRLHAQQWAQTALRKQIPVQQQDLPGKVLQVVMTHGGLMLGHGHQWRSLDSK